MDKLWLIIKREYLVRVKKKSFLIITLLAPLAMAILTFGMGIMTAYMSEKSVKNILVKDESGIFEKYKTQKSSFIYNFTDETVDSAIVNYTLKGYDILAVIPPFSNGSTEVKAKFYSQSNPGIISIEKIESDMAGAFKEYKIESSNIDKNVYENLFVNVSLEDGQANNVQDKTGKLTLAVATGLAFVMGFLLYMVIFIFGTQVMRSVMEEKVNRIVEVIMSSIKPFQLMIGKVIGVGAVGLTQLFIWVILIPVIMFLAKLFFGAPPQTEISGLSSQINPENFDGFPITQIINVFFSLNWWLILPSFILFFLGGYFLYSSMFAAVGSAVGDDQGDNQNLIWPITVPVLLGFIIMMNSVENPNSTMAIFGSIFPLFSPLVMPARLPFDPPIWQILISLVLLFLTCLMFIWLTAKIYRGGILLYGKKLTVKDMWKILINKY